MSLADLIHGKNTAAKFATATHAIFATPRGEWVRTVADVATVIVASPPKRLHIPMEKVVAGDPPVTATRWQFRFIDRDPLVVVFSPSVSHARALACYPDAVAVELQPDHPQRTATMREAEEITALVQAVYADDSEVDCNEALALALTDPDGALLCYRAIAHSRAIVLSDADDDRQRCKQCMNLRGRVCTIAQPGGLMSAARGYQPMQDTLQRCAGYQPNANDADHRPGRQR